MSFDDDMMPQDDKPAPPSRQQSLVDQARSYASTLTAPAPARQAPQQAPTSDTDTVAQYAKMVDPASRVERFQAVHDNGADHVQKFVKTYLAMPKDLQLREQERFGDTLAAYNEVLRAQQRIKGVAGSGEGVSGFAYGLGNLFNSMPEFASWLDKKTGGNFEYPIFSVDQAGNRVQDPSEMSRAEAGMRADQDIKTLQDLGLKNVADPATQAVISSLYRDMKLSGLIRQGGELFGVSKLAGVAARGLGAGGEALAAAGKPIRGAAVKGLSKIANIASGEAGGALGRYAGPMAAHGAVEGEFQGVREYDKLVADKIAQGVDLKVKPDGTIQTPEEARDDLLSFGNRQAYALGKAGSGAMHGVWAGLNFGAASWALGKAGRLLVPGPVKKLEAELSTVMKTDPGGFRPWLRSFVTENQLGRFAKAVTQGGADFAGGGLLLDQTSHLMLGTPLPASEKDDLVGNLVGGGVFGGLMHAFAGRAKPDAKAEKAMDPAERIERAKRGMGPNGKAAIDQLVNKFKVDPNVVAELAERSKAFGHDHADASAAIVQRYGFELAKSKGQIITGEGAQPQGSDVLQIPEKTAGEPILPPSPRPLRGPGSPPEQSLETEGRLATLGKVRAEAEQSGDRELAQAAQTLEALTRRPNLTEEEQGRYQEAMDVVQGRQSREATGQRFEQQRAAGAVQDLREDIDQLDRKIQTYQDTYGTAPNKMLSRRKAMQDQLSAAEQGNVQEDYQPRKRQVPLAERPARPEAPPADDESAVRRLIEGGREAPPAAPEAPAAVPAPPALSAAKKPPRDVVAEATSAPRRRRIEDRKPAEVHQELRSAAAQGDQKRMQRGMAELERRAVARGPDPDAQAEELLEDAKLAAPAGEPTPSAGSQEAKAEGELGKFAVSLAKEGKFNEAYATIEEMAPGKARELAKKRVDARVEVSVKKKQRARRQNPTPSKSEPPAKS